MGIYVRSLKPVCYLLSLVFVCMMCCPPAVAGDGYVVICNSENTITELSSTDIMNIFLGKKVTWDNGDKIVFATLKDNDTNKQFLKEHVRKNPQQFKNYWKQMLFTGKGVIPPSYDDDSGVIEFVSQNKGGIGYISSAPASGSVKTIQISN